MNQPGGGQSGALSSPTFAICGAENATGPQQQQQDQRQKDKGVPVARQRTRQIRFEERDDSRRSRAGRQYVPQTRQRGEQHLKEAEDVSAQHRAADATEAADNRRDKGFENRGKAKIRVDLSGLDREQQSSNAGKCRTKHESNANETIG